MKKEPSKEKYLTTSLSENGKTYFLFFRMPSRFGGKLVRQCLYTDDVVVARAVRDKYVVPILAAETGIEAMEEMARSIVSTMENTTTHIKSLKNIILGKDGVRIGKSCGPILKNISRRAIVRKTELRKALQ